ncbi:hypothetical protein AVEN_80577-1 [Araneus ventricosus]|uniref:Uncharacterized protein n=1 Tax=Araneus ventricosus TaxID=182803 RepID=A0A4Y2UZG2_ARAVE|nr:hypothetical protein AVEN_80577-1 [Araneus ventricosus]
MEVVACGVPPTPYPTNHKIVGCEIRRNRSRLQCCLDIAISSFMSTYFIRGLCHKVDAPRYSLGVKGKPQYFSDGRSVRIDE